ncbi:hypothetical protein [Tabrizicola aquatica]|uniref:hypothetical protein n=1 Tax=Tabrizicola aquatica TaxID=909926 RepID=UPI0011AEE24A|nr:hypothetical protein [Tabrizicola aquatica]
MARIKKPLMPTRKVLIFFDSQDLFAPRGAWAGYAPEMPVDIRVRLIRYRRPPTACRAMNGPMARVKKPLTTTSKPLLFLDSQDLSTVDTQTRRPARP